jgi:hypothetical protein
MLRLTVGALGALVFATVGCGQGNVFSLEVGDCFEEMGAGSEISNVDIVGCEEPHAYEVYAARDLTGDAFPGDTAIADSAYDTCYSRFSTYVGVSYRQSALDFTWLVPTSSSWDHGDREILCMVYDLRGAELTESMQGSRR